MRVVGMDIHRSFAQVAIWEGGGITKKLRADLVRDRFLDFARSLGAETSYEMAAQIILLRYLPKSVQVIGGKLRRAILSPDRPGPRQPTSRG